MPDTTLTINEAVDRQLRELAAKTGQPIAEVLEHAVEEYHRRQFWSAVDAGYAALRADTDAWTAEQADRAAWDGTLADGLDTTERWGDDRQPLPPADRPDTP
jgi:predicted transcriptional regulator